MHAVREHLGGSVTGFVRDGRQVGLGVDLEVEGDEDALALRLDAGAHLGDVRHLHDGLFDALADRRGGEGRGAGSEVGDLHGGAATGDELDEEDDGGDEADEGADRGQQGLFEVAVMVIDPLGGVAEPVHAAVRDGPGQGDDPNRGNHQQHTEDNEDDSVERVHAMTSPMRPSSLSPAIRTAVSRLARLAFERARTRT